MTSSLVTPDELEQLLAADAPVRLLDVRWTLEKPDGLDDYLAGHLPGAVYVDLDNDLAASGLPATEGRHPLPNIGELQAAVRRLGISNGDTIIAYDGWNNMGAARAWWLLGWAGLADVRVLNGGLDAWRDAGKPLEAGAVVAVEGTATLTPGHRPNLSIDGAAEYAVNGILIDSRAAERYRGDSEPLDPRAGHIPGAVNVPSSEYLDAGRFASPQRVREVFAGVGVDDNAAVATYCGSGITAAHTALALHEAGITAAVYTGSWSQWSNHADRPAATGL